MPDEQTTRLRLSPILREALTSRQAAEDVDEAILRALKARHPEQAAPLFPALTRILDAEAKRTGEDKEQTIQRLAASEPGPEIVLRTSSGSPPRTVSTTTVVRAGGKDYHSPDEMPPDLRRAVQAQRQRGKSCTSCPRVGCSLALIALLFRFGGR